MSHRAQIAHAFHNAAATYDLHAHQQREMIEKLSAMVAPYVTQDAWLLDAGCGTGYLKRHRPDWNIIGLDLAEGMCRMAQAEHCVVCADFSELPFKKNFFDILFNSASIQWVGGVEKTIVQFKSVLNSGGVLAVATYLQGTLSELSQAYLAAQIPSPVQPFLRFNEMAEKIEAAGFDLLAGEWEAMPRADDNLRSLLNYLRDIGAQTPAQKQRGLMTPRQYKALQNAYAPTNGKTLSTWNVGYFIAKKCT